MKNKQTVWIGPGKLLATFDFAYAATWRLELLTDQTKNLQTVQVT
jgi:hypothetical protein